MTGLGVVSPLGIGREEMWRSVAEGRSGAGLITLFDAGDSPVRMACEAHGFDPTDFMERRAARRMDRYAQLAVAAARLARGTTRACRSTTTAPGSGRSSPTGDPARSRARSSTA